MKRIIKNITFLLLAGALVSCGSKEKKVETAATETVEKVKVTVQKATMQDVDQENTYTATVEANVTNNIAPQSSVRINKIYVEVGDHVSAGQRLVSMDESNLDNAKVQRDNDQVEFNRVDELYKVGGISKSEWDAKKMALDKSTTTYRNLVQNTVLTSPISGVVSARNYDSGDMFSMGNPVLVIEQIRPVKINISVSESMYSKVKKGMTVNLTTEAFGDEVFTGKVSIVYPTIDKTTRTFPVEIKIDNRDERIRPGMFARVVLAYGSAKHVVVSDRAVLKQMGSGVRYVYVIKDGKSVFQEVTLGRHFDTYYEIISGLNDGDMVATTGQTRLNNGSEVEVVEDKSNAKIND